MIQNHLTSQPLSKRLKELGVPQKGLYYWTKYDHKDEWKIDYRDFDHKTVPIEFENCRAFLSSELGELLPRKIYIKKYKQTYWLVSSETMDNEKGWACQYRDYESVPLFQEAETMAESMGLMLEYLILNGLIKL